MFIEELERSAQSILPRIEKGDVIASASESRDISFEMDQLKSVEDNNRFALGLRLFDQGRVGNSYINSLRDSDELIERARQSASLGEELDLDLPGPCDYKPCHHYHQEVLDFTKQQAIEEGQSLLKSLKAIHKDAQVSLDYSLYESYQLLMNSAGFKGSFKETHAALSAVLLLVEEGGGLLEIGDSDSSYTMDLEKDRILRDIEWKFKHALQKSSLDSGYYPVIFAPDTMGLLLQPFTMSASSRTLYKGISRFQDKQDMSICSPRFSLWDDPLLENGPASYPFDDEGVLPQQLPIIDQGLFKNFIFDLGYARRMGRTSNGHGGRGVSSLPGPSYSNLLVSTGESTLQEMIADIDRGLIVYDVLGGGMSNMLAGDISVNIELGFLIEKGKVKGRVKDLMLAGNVFDWFNDIRSMENIRHRQGALYSPHICINKVSVAG